MVCPETGRMRCNAVCQVSSGAARASGGTGLNWGVHEQGGSGKNQSMRQGGALNTRLGWGVVPSGALAEPLSSSSGDPAFSVNTKPRTRRISKTMKQHNAWGEGMHLSYARFSLGARRKH